MYHLLYHLLFPLSFQLLFSSTNLLVAADPAFMRFNCTNEMGLEQISRISRFFRDENRLYFVLDGNVVFTQLFTKAERASSKEPSTIVHEFFTYKEKQKTLKSFGFHDRFHALGNFFWTFYDDFSTIFSTSR